jgi:hypothetical protein
MVHYELEYPKQPYSTVKRYDSRGKDLNSLSLITTTLSHHETMLSPPPSSY